MASIKSLRPICGGSDQSDDTILLAAAAVSAQAGISIEDNLSLSDSSSQISTPYHDTLTDSVGVTESFNQSAVFNGALANTLSLAELVQIASQRASSGASTDWRNPPRLVETAWTPRGSCACGLGHVGPQGCNGEPDVRPIESLTLSESLTLDDVSASIDSTRLLTCGFEEGTSDSYLDGGSSTIKSVMFTDTGGVFDNPPVVTDYTNTGTYSLKLLTNASGQFSANLKKAISPTLSYPNSIGFRLYVYFVSADPNAGGHKSHIAIIGSTNTNDYMAIGWKSTGSSSTFLPLMERGRFAASTTVGSALNAGQWYRVELWTTIQSDGSFSTTSQWFSADSTTALQTLTFTGGAGAVTTSDLISEFAFTPTYGIAPAYGDVRVDDLAIMNAVGPYGPGHVLISVPSAVSSAQFATTGSNNASAINYLPIDYPSIPATLNSTSTNHKVDKFTVTNPLPAGVVIKYIDLYMRGAVTSNITTTLSLYRENGTEIEGSNVTSIGAQLPSTGSGHIAVKFPIGIGGIHLSDMYYGYRSQGSSDTLQINTLWANVEYTV